MATNSIALAKRHKRFADHFFKNGNSALSYRYVYKCKQRTSEVGGHRLLQRADVATYLQGLEDKMSDALVEERVATENEILGEETKIALMKVPGIFDENGTMRDIKDWPEDLQAAVKTVKYDKMRTGTDAHGNGVFEKFIKEITFNDKGGALNRLEKCFGMQVERKELKTQLDIRMILTEIDGGNRDGKSLKLPQDCD